MNHPIEPAVTEHLHGRVLWKRDWGELTAHGIHLSLPLSPEKTPRLLQLTTGLQAPIPIYGSSRTPEIRSKESLTEREHEITRLIAQGYNNREMAERLSISVKTVETHRANIYAKLKVHNAVQLLRALEASGSWVVNHDQINTQ
ncbi:MAG: helix-turn-helix transcriptional regulator [Nitrospirae bacterium]|nr:helix-turn-helix transcriptional regulator [Nitrospirota bacterium]